MSTLSAKIIGLIREGEGKPGLLAEKLGVSRQALHGHLRELVAAKKIQKHGVPPHVRYSVMADDADASRIPKDYEFCRQTLLPRYTKDFSGLLIEYIKRTPGQKSVGKDKPDLEFLLDSAAVYSSNIEGNTLDLNSFLNTRMSPKKHRPKEAQEIEDLVSSYEYVRTHELCEKHMLHAHGMLSRQFVALSRQGVYRQERVGVFSRSGLVYMAVEPHLVGREMQALFRIVAVMLRKRHSPAEAFFWATWLHLMIALIHPFSDGNGRTARLCEKWFLAATLGERSFAIPSEELYWKNRPHYYANLRLGVNYWETDMEKAFPFFALLPLHFDTEGRN